MKGNRRIGRALVSWVLLLAPTLGGAAAKTQVTLVLSHEVARPGDAVTAGLRLRMPAGWHTYWKYPGDSGEAAAVKWTLPPAVTAGEILWPVPQKLIEAGFTTYVFHDEVILLVPLKIASDAAPGPLALKAKVTWQECEKVCIIGRTDVQGALVAGPATKPATDAALIEEWREKLPAAQGNLAVQARWEDAAQTNLRPLRIEWPADAAAREIDFFPLVGNTFAVKGETKIISAAPPSFKIRKLVEKIDGDWPKQLSGLLIEKGDVGRAREVRFAIASEASPPSARTSATPAGSTLPAAPAVKTPSLAVMLAFAFLGGLILNVMPCVLPVISLKVLSFVNQSGESPARVRALGLLYGLGVLVSFLALALLAIAVDRAGGQASWGMLLQNQLVRVGMTVLMTLVALNLFGVFEVTLSGRVMGAAGDLASREGYAGAFFNGILATVLATPCTAPFLSASLFFAITQPPGITLLIFLTVGLGLAAPFVVLCWEPAWLKLMPKPGKWMERFKVAMGFPMLATAVWLFWFTAPNYGDGGVLWLGLFLVLIAAAAWVWGEFVQRGAHRRGLAIGLALLLVAGAYGLILEGQLHWRTKPALTATPGSLKESAEGIEWQRWSPETVVKARAEGRVVLVDFTAKNCLNCQVNKRTSLEITSTRNKLKELNALALLGDFSNEDPLIAAELRRYQRPGVPLVLVYPRDAAKPPIVLPEILTPGIVLNALNEAANQGADRTPST